MIINAAHHYGRKVALDGRSMLIVAELAARLGKLKIPKGTLIPLSTVETLPDNEVLVICTGGQGEPGAALSRMAVGEHKAVMLNSSDTVVISSTPIPGNERSYAKIGDLLSAIGVKQYRHPTHEIDGSGPLHVSGHAARDEHAEMIALTKPRYFMPIYGGAMNRQYHKDIALQNGIEANRIVMAENGVAIELGGDKAPRIIGRVTSGAQFVDQTGAIVSEIVTRDRLQLTETGFVIVIATVNKQAKLVSSLDIVTRGFIASKVNSRIMEGIRTEVRKTLSVKKDVRSKTSIELLKRSIQASVGSYLLHETSGLPIIIPVVNVVGVTRVYKKPADEVH